MKFPNMANAIRSFHREAWRTTITNKKVSYMQQLCFCFSLALTVFTPIPYKYLFYTQSIFI